MNPNEKSWRTGCAVLILIIAIVTVFVVACWPTEAPPVTPRHVYSASPAPTKAAKPSTKPKKTKNDPRFDTCTEAINAGYGFYMKGVDPEYVWYKDSDGDGWVCE